MKAIVCHCYGSPDVLKLEEIEKPSPGDDEVLIKVRAASVNPIDRLFRGRPYLLRLKLGLSKPKDSRLGRDVAGQVEAVGRNVTQFKPGDEVFGTCRGALAEYACASESELVIKPEKVTFEQAASLPIAGLTAFQGLRDKGKLQPGQQVLINGAGGGVGTFAVQIAKALGARVTGVCSTAKTGLVSSIGADHVLDYTHDDFADGSQRYDLILDIGGNSPLSRLRRALTPGGTLVIVGGEDGGRWTGMGRQLRALALSPFTRQRLTTFVSRHRRTDLETLAQLIEADQLTPVIGKTYPLRQAADAMRDLLAGQARGKLVLTMTDAG